MMASMKDELNSAIKSGVPVLYFASTEQALLRAAGKWALESLQAQGEDTEVTRLDGSSPDFSALIEATGTISFFGGRRIVELRELSPSSLSDKDTDELAELFAQLSSATLLVTALYKDKRAAASAKAKKLFAAAKKAGYATELAAPTQRDNINFLHRAAQSLGAEFAPGAAEALLERAGDDRVLLQSETEKLAAICGYTKITADIVARHSTHNLEADVFELSRLITSRKKQAAQQKLMDLLALRHEPIAITAALAGSFVDMYRVRCGAEQGHPPAVVFRELGYKGNDYRLKKAGETASRYTTAQLEECVLLLHGLDASLKSSALSDKSRLLQAVVGQLMLVGARP